jgi:glycosidase
MQWTSEPNGGGFSTADPSTFPAPLPGGRYGPKQVNVRDQQRDPESLLSWIRLLAECYRACPELAWGTYTVLDPGPDARPVLAHRCDTDGQTVLALHNFADTSAKAVLLLPELGGTELTDVLDPSAAPVKVAKDGAVTVPVGGYGCRWLRGAGG